MGGYGSTRWDWHTKATTVEDCLQLDANRWMREGIIKWDTWKRGLWCWYRGDEWVSTIGYEVDTRDRARPWVRLYYTSTESGAKCDYRIPLQTTAVYFGGHRWWYTCPGQGCWRRVGKLYLPPGGLYFGCRHCYKLTYTSCQESHKYDSLFAGIGAQMGLSGAQVARLFKRRF